MKNLLVLAACAALALSAAAQDRFLGEKQDLLPWMAARMTCPAECDSTGVVIMRFTLKSGVPNNIKITDAPCQALSDLVARSIRSVSHIQLISTKPALESDIFGGFDFSNGTVTPVEPTMPLFKGGSPADFRDWMIDRLYGTTTYDGGAVRVKFVIDKDGTLGDVEVTESSSSDLTDAVLKAMKKSPKWTPGHIAGKTIRIAYTVSIKFQKSR